MLPFFLIKKAPFAERKLRSLYVDRALQIVPRITPFISKDDHIIDIGCGTGSVAKVIKKEKSPQITLVDIQHNPMSIGYPVVIYDGKNLPFADNQFTISLLTAVLHHARSPMKVLNEAIRVTQDKLIIMEDVFTDVPGRVMTFIGDCVLNWEIHSPFKNKTSAQWLKIFEKKNLRLLNHEEFQLRVVGFPFKLAIFVLEKKKSRRLRNEG